MVVLVLLTIVLATLVATLLLGWLGGLLQRGTPPSMLRTLLVWAVFAALSLAAIAYSPPLSGTILVAMLAGLFLTGLTVARYGVWISARLRAVDQADASGRAGTIRIAHIGGVPISVHWTVAVVAGFIALTAGFAPMATLCGIAFYLGLLALHEFGHFGAARAFGLQVFEVRFNGLDAWCRMEAPRTRGAALCVFLAGVGAQFVVLVVTIVLLVVFDPPKGPVANAALKILVVFNALMIFENLLPIRTASGQMTDGYVVRELIRHGRVPAAPDAVAPATPSPIFPPETRLLAVDGFAPAGFTGGIEILNDNTTPMDLVVDTLMRNLRFDHDEAVRTMYTIHQAGGVLLPFAAPAWAEAVAAGITADAVARGHVLVCRAVPATATTT